MASADAGPWRGLGTGRPSSMADDEQISYAKVPRLLVKRGSNTLASTALIG